MKNQVPSCGIFSAQTHSDLIISSNRISYSMRVARMAINLILSCLMFAGLHPDVHAQACNQIEDFTAAITIAPSQAPGVWYVDRYAPNGFFSPSADLGGAALKHSINAADGAVNRLPAFQGSFYNTQGRKYDLPASTRTMQIDLYVPAAWATSNKREAGFWGTAFDGANAVSGFPIIEFASDGAMPRFRVWESGTSTWVDLGLPMGFVYNAWYTLSIEVLNSGEFLLKAGDLQYTTNTSALDGSVRLANVILQGHNFNPGFPDNASNPGVTYDIYWDNFVNNAYTVENTSLGLFYCSLQDAIDAASAGHTIVLLGNLFEGLITVDEEVTINGQNFTITSNSPSYGINPTVANVTIENLTLENAGTFGIQTGCGSDNLVLTNVTVNNSGGTGITLNGSDNCVLTNITSTNNGGNGVNITNCDNTMIDGITTSGNTFGVFNAGIGIFTSAVYCLPAGVNGVNLTGTISIAEDTKVYSQKANAADPLTGLTGATIGWAVGIGPLDRSYWVDKATAYEVVKTLFDAPYNYPNTLVYVAEMSTENFYVDDDPDGDATTPMLIQTAVTFEVPGKTIFLEGGTYAERVILNKSLVLSGAGVGSSVLDGTGLVGNGNGITINNAITGVTIQGLTVRDYTGANGNSNAGIYAIGGNNNLTVQNVDIADNVGGSGFYANGPITNVLINNVLSHGHTVGARGIVIWNGLKSNITITNCTVYGNNCCGIELQDGTASGVTMTGNVVYNNGDNGIGLVGLQGPGANLIQANTLTDNGRFGIEIKNPDGSGASSGAGSIVVDNNDVIRTLAIGDARDIAGIAVFRRGVLAGNVEVPEGVYVSSNDVSGYTQPSTSEGFGIVIEGINHTITNNNVNGNDVGLQQQAGHTPLPPADGEQANMADTYFGRGNAQLTCGNSVLTNTITGNTVDTRNVGVGSGLVTNINTSETFCSIQSAINDANTVGGHTISVGPGFYNEDVLVNKAITIQGAGIDVSTVSGPIGGGGSTFQISASGVIIDGFTITRAGNNTTDWNDGNLNFAGIAIQGQTVDAEIRNNKIIGNRSGIDVNNSDANNIHNNIITSNHTGMIFRNQTDNTILMENEIVNNRTVGVLFLAANTTGVPPQSALFSSFNNNDISDNWYGQIVDRQIGGALPPPGSNMKNFECNWYGSVTPWVSTANSAEPAYAGLIPVEYGGSSVPPGGQPDILGPASANFDYVSFLINGVDSDGMEFGFQPAMGTCAGSSIDISSATQSAETCIGNNGSILVTFSGGVSPYTIAWAGPDPGSTPGIMSSPYNIPNLSAGAYTVTVTDFNGTTSTASTTVLYEPVTNVTQSTTYSTIQAAINAANTGDAIQICAGTYVENVIVDEQVTLTGAGQASTFIYPALSAPNICGGASLCPGSSNIFLVQASNVTIQQLTIDGDNTALISGITSLGADLDARNGIITNHSAGVFQNLNVNNVTVNNIYLRGIYASSGGTFAFTNNTVNNVAADAGSIAIFNFGGAGTFTGNMVSNANDGIASNWSQGSVYSGNTVTLSASGIHSDNNGGSGGIADIIQNNTVTNSTANGYGIWVFAPYRNVQVLNNTVTNVDVGLANAGQQLPVTVSFLGNTIDGMNKSNSTGVYHTTSLFGFGTSDVTGVYSNNFIRNNTDAFYIEYQAGNANTITTNNNSITGNTNGVILVPTGGTLTENFQCNWWGSAGSGAVDLAAASSTNYTPWLVNGTDASADPGFQPAAMACGGTDVVITSADPTNSTCSTAGSIEVTYSGGTGPYNISWTGGSDTGISNPYTITGLAAGMYNITVTDVNGSTGTSSATVMLMGVENTTNPGFYLTIQAAIDAATNGDILEVCAGTYTENITINKPLTINGPNAGTPGTSIRAGEALLSDCNIDITAAGTVVLDGFKIYQTDNNADVILISGGTVATIQNNIIERFGVVAGQFVRAITTSAGAGAKLIQYNLITGDVSGGLFSGHKSWNSGIYVNGAGSNINIENNTIQNCRSALNLDDFNAGIVISGNILNNSGTMMSFGGVSPTNGQYVLGSNNFTNPASTLMNLSNVDPAFRIDITTSMINGAVFNTLTLADLFLVESTMFHRGRSGRNGLVYYVLNNQYVVSGLTTIQSAVDYAASGDIINVNNGTYNEEVTVDLPVVIDGATGICGDVIIEGGSVRQFGVRVLAGIQNVTLRDFKVQNTVGTNAGIWAATNNNGLNIDNLCLENTSGVGAILAQGPVNGITINDCEVSGSMVNGRGIVIWDGHKQNITITGNNVHDIGGCCGIELQDGSASGVTMTGNTVTNIGDSGMSAVGLDGTTGNNTISSNIITNTGRFGLEIKNPNGNGSNILINGNTVTRGSLNPGELRDIAGIAVFRRALTGSNVDVPKGVQVTGNIVNGYTQTNGASNSEGFGIVIEGISHTVNTNTLNGNDVGIQQQAGHLPYPGDGDQSNLSDTYFGRGNSPMTCGNTIGVNTFVSNGTDTRSVGVGGGIVYNTSSMETFCSIQSAINDAETTTGHTLTIADGTYNENVNVTKELILSGGGSGSDPVTNTVLTPSTSCSGIGLQISAANVTVQGMHVTNYQTAMQLNSVVNPTINNMALVDYCAHGISLAGSLNTSVDILNTTIQRTTSLAGTVGIRAGTATGVSGLLIDGCSITGNALQGIVIFQAGTPNAFEDITIQNSTISNNAQKGMYFEKLNNALFKNLVMDNNGTDPSYGFNNGIDINLKFDDYAGIIIEDCDITNSGYVGGMLPIDPQNAAAITIKARDDGGTYGPNPATLTDVTIINNTISGPQNGIRFGEFGQVNNGPSNVTIEGNDLSHNFANKAIIRRTNDDINLVCNWHGTISLPDILADIADAGTGSTILSSILLTGGSNPGVGFQPTGSCGCPSGNLVTNTDNSEEFCTIQAAIDAPSTINGHTLVVSEGTYIENIIVNKELTILGPNSGANPCVSHPNPPAIVVPSVSAISSGEIFHVAADNVTISGFTIDGDNTAIASGFTSTNGADIDAAEGVTVYETGINNLTVSNNIIQNLSYFAVTLYDYPAAVPSSGHTIANNKIQNLGTYDATSGIAFWGGGVLLYNNQYAAVTNNCMENVRIGVQTGNFSQANPGSSTYQEISGNTISSRRRGVFHNLFYGTASPYTLSGNTLTELDHASDPVWDGVLFASQSVSSYATNNTITGAGIALKATEGYEVWNVNSLTPVIISGGNVSGVSTGLFVNNYDGYPTAGSDAPFGGHATVSGLSISTVANGTGIHIKDNALSTHANVQLTLGAGVALSGGTTGIRVENSSASIVGGTLNNLSFTGQSGQYIELVNNPNDLDATAVTFDGTTGGGATFPQLFAIEDKIHHEIEDNTLGFVTVNASNAYVTDITLATASNNDYTRLRNAIELVDDNWSINLNGDFNWTEVNAASSWALGNDETNATNDDYSILVPANLNGVTFTAPEGLGTASISGPGDLPAINLEGVFYFDGAGDNQDWTISNIEFLEFDLSIGMFFGAGGSDAYNNTTITNNHFDIATDLNAVVAPADLNQNIGIHYSFGANQTISNNVFNIPGDGVSNGVNYSTTVVMQSNTSGGSVYDGLLITGNTMNILNAQDATNPEVVLGIWENGHAHTSNITVSNNQFNNLDVLNDPVLNLQRAFRVTSHSGVGSTVTYSGNSSEGANIGFQWLAGSNFAGNNPVLMTGNFLSDNNIGILVQSNGLALLTNTNFDGATDNDRDLQIQPGSVVTTGGGNQWAGEDYYVENLSANALDITGETFDQANHFRRTDRVYDARDNAASGLVRFNGINLYVSAPATGLSDETIPNAISAAAASGDRIHIEPGSYTSDLDATSKEVIVAPGASPGCVTLSGNMVLTGGDELEIELDGGTACSGYDRFIVDGTVTLGGAFLDATASFMPSNGQTFTIIVNDLADAVVGQFMQGTSITISGYPFVINYAGGDGNDVVLEMCTGETTITTAPTVVQNTGMHPATVPDAGSGATYLWSIVNGNITGGQGTSSITYSSLLGPNLTISVTVEDENGCVSTDQVVVNVIAVGPSSFAWIPDNTNSCGAQTNCCADIICYTLQYTPGVTGDLTSYTTGFTANCLGGLTPVNYNESCVMNDNSFEINGCLSPELAVLFNSSGNGGSVPVVANMPINIHKVCFNLSSGETITVTEDIITNLSASIELSAGGEYTEFPAYTTTNLTKPLPVIPAAGVATVSCPDDADAPVFPALPVVLDYCGNPLDVVLVSTVDNPMSLTCEGTRVYNYEYRTPMGCVLEVYPWTYTYTIDYSGGLTGPPNAMSTVSCPADAVNPGAPIDIVDACGRTVSAVLVGSSTPPACEGSVVWTFRYTACDLTTTVDWTHTYTIDYSGGLTPPANGMSTVSCPIQATDPGAPADITDACGRSVSAVLVGSSTPPACEGSVVWTYRYTACDNTTTADWIYTYTIDYSGGLIPPVNGMSTVSCPIQATDPGAPADIMDACGRTVSADLVGSSTPPACEGSVVWTYRYTACDNTTIADWTYTYTIDRLPFANPMDGGSTVNCPLATNTEPTPPSVIDNCGNSVPPVGPVVSPIPGCGGTRTYTWTYTDCANNVQDYVYTYTVECDPLTLKVLLQGPYDTGTDLMTPSFNINHVLPGQDKTLSPNPTVAMFAPFTPPGHPFTGAPWNYNNPMNTGLNYGDPSVGALYPYPADVVDWVLVTVRENGIMATNDHWTCAGWVHTDGDVSFPEPCGALVLTPGNQYYVVVEQRNHLPALDTALMTCSGYVVTMNMTTQDSYKPTFRFGQAQLEPGIFGLYRANGEQSNSRVAISSPDLTAWRLLQNGLGYGVADYNMDVKTDSDDETFWKLNQNKTSGVNFQP